MERVGRCQGADQRVLTDLGLVLGQREMALQSGVRLPKSVAFPDDVRKVDVIVLGNARLLAPAGEAWATWFDG